MHTIGVDIGGTQLRAAFFDANHRIVERAVFPNERSLGVEANLDKISEFINRHKNRFPSKGIGIGCPGPLDFPAGKILNPPNLYGWNNFELVRYMKQKTGFNAALNNDANAAGLAEALLGAGKGRESVFYMTVSTGIGGAYIYRGELVAGAHSAAAEVYNLIVCEDDFSHNDANAGSLNEVCSGDAMSRQAGAAYGRPVGAKELYDELYLKKKDAKAFDIIESCADNLAKGIANISCVVDPDIFILGGSIALYSRGFLDLVAQKAGRYLIHPEALQIEKASLGGDAGLIGAALLISRIKWE
ncbi:MAG: ROK family protein [Treponema sp.]|jgi:glucokinase|nr:ROK family protein [Treponema sp.]